MRQKLLPLNDPGQQGMRAAFYRTGLDTQMSFEKAMEIDAVVKCLSVMCRPKMRRRRR